MPAIAMLLYLATGEAALDLRNASVEVLDNGLTVILLPDRHFPVASVQSLYRVGARNEVTGKTGLAHFLEHMAFRDSKNFPGTGLVSSIYAVGGEWHGYTWTDETTYFSTVPREHVGLLLRIEADRMSALIISEEDMQAERGAVLAEMHMYENLPSSMLVDAVNYMSFLAHPYRNNTIGWESDIQSLEHADVLDFYRQHYHPANAVIAVVGDFDRDLVREQIQVLFGNLPRRPATPPPHTIEPRQNGLRRMTLRADNSQRQFMIAYRAPSANSPDYAPFLVLQEILGTGSGVNFLQNDWGTAIDSGSVLFGSADNMTTWYPPSAQDYVFIIGGFAPADDTELQVEERVESRVARVRDRILDAETVAKAVADVEAALTLDVQTTEDAAHQLAYFSGLGALDVLLELPRRLAAVNASDVQRLARTYLSPEQRSIAWHLPTTDSMQYDIAPRVDRLLPPAALVRPPGVTANPPPLLATLSGGMPVVLQPSNFSPLVHLQIVFPSNNRPDSISNDPILDHSSLHFEAPASQLGRITAQSAQALATTRQQESAPAALSGVPEVRLDQEFDRLIGAHATARTGINNPALIAVAGDFDGASMLDELEAYFGKLHAARLKQRPARALPDEAVVIHIGSPVAQAQLGYLVPAPGPEEPLGDAYRLVLYILSHDYEGRLGKKAISDSGLAYYIASRYRSDGSNAWITLSAGVDPDKLSALRDLFASELERLSSDTPTELEVRDAKQNMIGRLESAAQSNAELTERLATEWLWYGELLTPELLRERLDVVSRADIVEAAKGLARGIQLVVMQ
ncbi:MAG TPA: insulinase family protein [Woeseiaceae bacterium]|nr:insulinase family protein [Woeseiaceae bacterium]